jgi:putative sterol carrier protein
MAARPVRLVADRFARWVAHSPDERLDRAMTGWRRRWILRGIRAGMESEFDAGKGADVNAVIDYRVGGRPDGGYDHFQVAIDEGRAKATRSPELEPTVTIEMGAVPFLKVVTGNASGPELFMNGRLKVQGDLMFATRVPSLYRIPKPRS